MLKSFKSFKSFKGDSNILFQILVQKYCHIIIQV